MIKIETHPNGYTSITGCPNCDNAHYLWFDNEEWVIDTDNGIRGFHAEYCPACGTHLTKRAVDRLRRGRAQVFSKIKLWFAELFRQFGGN